jgi:hypothetical protein
MAERDLRYRVLRRFRGLRRLGVTPRMIPEGLAGVLAIGHRDYVGGLWEEMGQLQFDFLVSRGLRPEHVLLDIACGSLRGGVYFIRYLDPGNYLGIEKERALIRRALAKELSRDVQEQKRPEFVVSGTFEFERFSKRADYSLAQSLFTHLNAVDIERCLNNLRANVEVGHQLFATFAPGSHRNEARSHARASFFYAAEELEAIGERCGFSCDYVGDWGHPRNQMMMRFLAR